MNSDQLMNTAQAAAYLGIHEVTVRIKAERGELPTAGKVGNRWRFRKSSLDDKMRQMGTR